MSGSPNTSSLKPTEPYDNDPKDPEKLQTIAQCPGAVQDTHDSVMRPNPPLIQ